MAALAVLCAAAASAHAGPISLVNSGFEGNVTGNYTYYTGTTVNGWTYTGKSGITAENLSFKMTNAEGNQAAFIQSNTGAISQSFDFGGGYLSIGFLAQSRNWYGGNTFNVFIDDIKLTFAGVDSLLSPTDRTFTSYTSDLLQLAGGTHTLRFVGTSSQDYTTFIDNVSVNAVAAVPEPGSVALVGLGFAALLVARRKRRA